MSKISELRLRNVPQEVVAYYDRISKFSDVPRNELIIDDLIAIANKSIKEEVHEEYNYYLSKIFEVINELNNKISTADELSILLERNVNHE